MYACPQVAYFQGRLEKAMERVRLVLARERQPVFASETHHAYEDKYLVAEFVTNAAIASQLNSLELLGLSEAQLAKMCEWAHGGSAVSLRFRSEETCTYLREESRDVEDPRKHVEELSVGGVAKAAWTSKVVTKVTEYFWKFEVSYKLEAVRGVGAEAADRLEIQAKTSNAELKTTVKETPRPAKVVPACEEQANITALVKLVPAGTTSPAFKIDRAAAACKTPCWNPQVEEVRGYNGNLERFFACVANYLEELLQVKSDGAKSVVDVAALGSQGPLVLSVAPFLKPEGRAEGAAPGAPEEKVLVSVSTGSGRLLAPGDTNLLLAEEARHLRQRLGEVRQTLPAGDGVCNGDTGAALLVLRHGSEVCDLWRDSLCYIEDLLRKQLAAAIGKEVSAADFAEYMRFHNRKLFSEAYLPKPFCFAVRRSKQHAPEGTLSIEQVNEAEGGGFRNEPIVSMVAAGEGGRAMRFPINASSNIEFTGERYLHAWLNHTFQYDDGTPMQLVARARQFSSMLVLVGRIASATVFEPKHAAIIQNKDELKIPLELSTIPTPKEFKDAIESLSPEQQAFAKAFRSMQLESTLFGVLVIHIKPQLEKVLRLAPDSLTKEIKLTQDLMQLFIKYQIPSDLLSYDASSSTPDGGELLGNATPAERLAEVKEHVKAMQEMIEASKKEEIQERTMEARFANPITIQEQRGGSCDLLDFADVPLGGAMPQPQAMCFGAAPGGACFGGFGGGAPSPAPPMMARGMMMPMNMAPPSSQMLMGYSGPPVPACSAPPMAACMPPAPCMAAAPPADLSTVLFAQPMMVQDQVCTGMDAGFEVVTGTDMPETAPGPPPREDASPTQGGSASSGAGPIMDYTQVPKEMDKKFEALDTDSALRPTIINVGDSWQKSSQKALLAPPKTEDLGTEQQKEEKNAAFDLLDALTKSGALPVEHAALHVVIAATHCFDKSVADTVIQDSINPIEKVERSTLIMATTIHRQPAAALVQPAQLARLRGTAPTLFLEDAA